MVDAGEDDAETVAETPAEIQGKPELDAPAWMALALVVLPALYLAMVLVLRADAGPFWMWYASLPGYAYLLDAVNLLNLYAPGYVDDPGTPVQMITALVLMSAHGFADAATVTAAVLDDPEAHLRAVTTVFYALNAFALVAVGLLARVAAGGLIPALLVQSGPFMSMVVVRHGLYAGPDALLILTALALAFMTLLALRPGLLERHRLALAVAFGVIAGFGMAIKAAAAPVFVLPVFLLWGARPLAVYAGTAALVFGLLTLPAAGALGTLISGVGLLPADGGDSLDMAGYLRQIARMFSRPVLAAPVVMAVLVLLDAWRRGRAKTRPPNPGIRALAGTVLAQVLLVAIAARQPGAQQLIPAMVLSGLALALVYSVVAGYGTGSRRAHFWGREITAILFGVFLLAQGAAVVGQDIELRSWRIDAARIDNAGFEQCVRVYFRSASDPGYALLAASHLTGSKLPDLLAARTPRNDLWLDAATQTVRDWYGEADLLEFLAAYPCAMFRGTDRRVVDDYLERNLPGLILRDGCSTRQETVLTMGVDCSGELTGK